MVKISSISDIQLKLCLMGVTSKNRIQCGSETCYEGIPQ
jgi:hypothetical protein